VSNYSGYCETRGGICDTKQQCFEQWQEAQASVEAHESVMGLSTIEGNRLWRLLGALYTYKPGALAPNDLAKARREVAANGAALVLNCNKVCLVEDAQELAEITQGARRPVSA
jgi:hypothetical protein